MQTRVIKTDMWDEEKVVSLSDQEKVLHFVLITNRYIGQSRIYQMKDRQIHLFTGMSYEDIQKNKISLENKGFYIFKDDFICVAKAYGFIDSYYKGGKNDSAKQKEISLIPQEVLEYFKQKLDTLSIGYIYPTDTTINNKSYNILNNIQSIKVLSSIKNKGISYDIPKGKPLSEKPATKKNVKKEKVKKPAQRKFYKDLDTASEEENKNIVAVIKAFEAVDIKNKNYYMRDVERDAALFLIRHYEFEKVIKFIKYIPKWSGSVPMFPTITTPCELRDKWVKAKQAFQRHYLSTKNNNKKNKDEVIM